MALPRLEGTPRAFNGRDALPWIRKGSARHLERFGPLGLTGLAVGFNLWVLRSETTVVMNLNDSALHLLMVRWARQQIDAGRVPLDGWFPYLSLGLPQFHHYQSLPHVVTAYLSLFTGTAVTFNWLLYLLLAFWPVSVYISARLFGWDGWTAAAAAVIAPLLVSVTGYGYEHSSYTWRGLGTYTQLWGMWLLPLALGLSWRAVRGTGSLALAALFIALTIASHFLTGYLALLAIGLWVLVSPTNFIRNLVRAAIVGVGSLLVASWVIVPLVADSRWAGDLEWYRGTFWFDSYGAPKVLGWLLTGQIYDSGRLPVVTVLVGVGLAICLRRFLVDARARALIAVWGLSLLLYFGRPTVGPVLNLLPGGQDLPLHRYLAGVQLAGILMAGVAGAWLGRQLIAAVNRFAPAFKPVAAWGLIPVLGIALLQPAWSQLADYDLFDSAFMAEQATADATDGADLSALIARAQMLGPGRAYAGAKNNWGKDYRVGQVPVYIVLENHDMDAIGMWLNTQSLSSDVEVRFDESNPAQYDLFNIRYLFLPLDRLPSVPATLVAKVGRHALWQVSTSGYLEVVDTIGPAIVADRTDMGRQNALFLESDHLAHRQFPTVAFDGGLAAPPTLASDAPMQGPAGIVEAESSAPADGVFSASVVLNRPAVVLLKSTYDPRWRVRVDGVEVAPEMIAPSFVGRRVAPGRHSIVFEYVPYPAYPLWFGIGLLTLLLLAVLPRAGRLGLWPSLAKRAAVAPGQPDRMRVPAIEDLPDHVGRLTRRLVGHADRQAPEQQATDPTKNNGSVE